MPRPLLYTMGLAAAVVLGALLLQLYPLLWPQVEPAAPQLDRLIPANLEGWSGRDLPLGDTEETRRAVSAVLQFDQHVSRLYTRGGDALSIYVAYWRANKVPPRAVGVHTPDTCWVQGGWECRERRRSVPLRWPDVPPFPAAEYGVYTFHGVTQHVYFWHLVGGQPYSYEQDGMHALLSPWKDLQRFGLNQRHEQLFVRLASNQPFERLLGDPGVLELLRALAELQTRS